MGAVLGFSSARLPCGPPPARFSRVRRGGAGARGHCCGRGGGVPLDTILEGVLLRNARAQPRRRRLPTGSPPSHERTAAPLCLFELRARTHARTHARAHGRTVTALTCSGAGLRALSFAPKQQATCAGCSFLRLLASAPIKSSNPSAQTTNGRALGALLQSFGLNNEGGSAGLRLAHSLNPPTSLRSPADAPGLEFCDWVMLWVNRTVLDYGRGRGAADACRLPMSGGRWEERGGAQGGASEGGRLGV